MWCAVLTLPAALALFSTPQISPCAFTWVFSVLQADLLPVTMSVSLINPNAEVMAKAQALSVNVAAGKGLQDLLRTNLGAFGLMRYLVLCLCPCGGCRAVAASVVVLHCSVLPVGTCTTAIAPAPLDLRLTFPLPMHLQAPKAP